MKEINSGGYVSDSIEASLWCFLTTDSYEDSVLKAVNLGRDTDTTGAITGGLSGIYYGVEHIPTEWKEVLVGKDFIERLCNGVKMTDSQIEKSGFSNGV